MRGTREKRKGILRVRSTLRRTDTGERGTARRCTAAFTLPI